MIEKIRELINRDCVKTSDYEEIIRKKDFIIKGQLTKIVKMRQKIKDLQKNTGEFNG